MVRLKHHVNLGFFRGVRGRRLVAAVLLVGIAGLAVCNAEIIGRRQPRNPEHRFALRAPASLYERFRAARYKPAPDRFAFYLQAARFEGARLLVSRAHARRHGRMLERVSRVSVEQASAGLRVSQATAKQLTRGAEFTGELDGRPVYFMADPAGDYALAEVGKDGPILWIPRRLVESVP
jgi:hypothetical protein